MITDSDFIEMYERMMYVYGYLMGLGKNGDDQAKIYSNRVCGKLKQIVEERKKTNGSLQKNFCRTMPKYHKSSAEL